MKSSSHAKYWGFGNQGPEIQILGMFLHWNVHLVGQANVPGLFM